MATFAKIGDQYINEETGQPGEPTGLEISQSTKGGAPEGYSFAADANADQGWLRGEYGDVKRGADNQWYAPTNTLVAKAGNQHGGLHGWLDSSGPVMALGAALGAYGAFGGAPAASAAEFSNPGFNVVDQSTWYGGGASSTPAFNPAILDPGYIQGGFIDPALSAGAGGAGAVSAFNPGYNALDPSTYGGGGGSSAADFADPLAGLTQATGSAGGPIDPNYRPPFGDGVDPVQTASNFAPPGGVEQAPGAPGAQPTPASGPGVSTPASQSVATTSGPAVSGAPIGGDPTLPAAAQGTPGVPPSPTQAPAPVVDKGISAGAADKLRIGMNALPPGTTTAGKSVLDRLGLTKDGGIGPNVLPAAGLVAGALANKQGAETAKGTPSVAQANQNVTKAAETQKQELTQLNAPARAASEQLIQQGLSGTVPPNILSKFDQTMTDRIEQIRQRYASMGRDPDKDSAAATEIARAKQDRDQQIAAYSSELLRQGLAAAGISQAGGSAAAASGVNAAQSGVNAALAGAQSDREYSNATAEMLKNMAMLQSMTASREGVKP